MYPWGTVQSVIDVSRHIARIAFIAAKHDIHVIVDDDGWIRLSKDGKLDGSMALNTLEYADDISEEYILQDITTLLGI